MLAPALTDGDRDERTTTVRTTIAAAAVTASLIGGGAVGALYFTPSLAGAQDATDGTDGTELVEDDRGGEHRIGWFRTALDDLVAAGTIDQAQADAVAAALAAARPDRGSHDRPGAPLDRAADILGITVADLRAALGAGDTLAEVAEANGSSTEVLVDALVADLVTRLAGRVAAGDLTQAEADAHSAAAEDRLTDFVQREHPAGDVEGPRDHRRPGHRLGPPPVADDTAGEDGGGA